MFLVESGDDVRGGTWLPRVQVVADDSAHVTGTPGRDVMVLAGRLNPDARVGAADLLQWLRDDVPPARWGGVKGRYAVAYAAADGRLVTVTDHAAIHDVYSCAEPGHRVVSDDLPALLGRVSPQSRRLDEQAATAYLALGFLLNGRTFAAGVRRLPPGTHEVCGPRGDTTATRFWRYELRSAGMSEEEMLERSWAALVRSAERVTALTAPGSRCVLGLSGGLDSRLTAALLTAAGADVTAYFFGEPESDAGRVAGKVAGEIGIPLHTLGRNREFPRYFRRSMETRPLADLEWCKYLVGVDELLTGADALVSGHLGDHLFGEWSIRAGWGPDDDRSIAADLYRGCVRERVPEADAEAIVDAIASELAAVGGPVVQRKQAFWFDVVNMTIKQCGLFRTPAGKPHLSLFEDVDVIELALAVPASWRRRNRFYRSLYATYLPALAPERIPLENGSNDHKPIEDWLRGNDEFRGALGEVIDLTGEVLVDGETKRFAGLADAIVSGRASRGDVHRFFRRCTVRAYQRMYE